MLHHPSVRRLRSPLFRIEISATVVHMSYIVTAVQYCTLNHLTDRTFLRCFGLI